MVDVIDEAAVRIVAEVQKDFSERVRRSVDASLRGVNDQVKKKLAPLKKTISDSIVDPIQATVGKVDAASKAASTRIADNIKSGADKAGDAVDRMTAKISADLDAIDTDRTITVDVDADTSRASEQLELFDENLEITIEANTTLASEQLALFEAEHADDEITVEVDADTDPAENAVRGMSARISSLWSATMAKFSSDSDDGTESVSRIGRQIDDTSRRASGAVGPLRALFTGDDGGPGGSGQSLDRIQGSLIRVAASAAIAVSAVTPVSGLLVGAAASLVAVAGAAGLAAGAMISAGVAASSLGLAFAVLKTGLSGVGDALKAQSAANKELAETGEVSAATQEKLDAAMKGLAPSARELVKVIGSIGPAWSKVATITQQALFKDTAPLMQRLSDKFLPVIREQFKGIATDFNGFGRSAVENITKASTVDKINDVLASLRVSLQSIIPALGNLAAGFGTLFAGATGEAEGLSKGFLNLSERFREFAGRVTESGKFQDFLSDATEAAKALFGAIGAIGSVLQTIFAAGAAKGVGLLQNLDSTFSSLNDTLESASGQKALAGFFDTIAVAAQGLRDIMSVLRPVLSGIGDVFDQLSPALDKVRVALLPILQVVGEQLGSALSFIAPAIGAVVEGLAIFIDVLGPLAPVIGAVALAFGALQLALALGPIGLAVIAIGGLAFAMKQAYDNSASFRAIVDGVVEAVSTTLTPAIDFLKTSFDSLIGALPAVGDAIADALGGASDAVAGMDFSGIATALSGAFDQIVPALKQVGDGFAVLADAALPVLQTVADFVTGTLLPTLTDLGEIVASNIGPFFQNLANIFTTGVVPALKQVFEFGNFLLKTLSKVADTVAANLVPIIDQLITQFNDNLLPALTVVAQIFAEKVLPVIIQVAKPIISLVSAIVRFAAAVLGTLIPPLLQFIGPVLGGLIVILANVIGYFFDFIGAILSIPSVLGSLISAIASFVETATVAIANFVLSAIDYFKTLPEKIANGMATLGVKISGAFTEAFDATRAAVTTGISAIENFFRDLPEKIVNALSTLRTAISTAFTTAFTFVREKITAFVSSVVTFFQNLPGKAASALSSLSSKIGSLFTTAMDNAKEKVRNGIEGIMDFFRDLPGKISGLASKVYTSAKTFGGRILDGIVDALKSAGGAVGDIVDALKSALNQAIPDRIGVTLPKILGGGSVGIDIPQFAKGGIFDRPTLGIFGEAGREAILPVTKPARAAALLFESGLMKNPMFMRRLNAGTETHSKSPVSPWASGLPSSFNRPGPAPRYATAGPSTGSSTLKKVDITNHNTFNLPDVDPTILAIMIASRTSGGAER